MSMDYINISGIVGPENLETYKRVMNEVASAVPGVDEAASFSEVIDLIKVYNFSTVVFDTAPTGHTLRLLNLPNVIEKGLGKVAVIKEKFGGMLSNVAATMMDPQTSCEMMQKVFDYLESMKKTIEGVNAQFKNPVCYEKHPPIGTDNVHRGLHSRVPEPLRNRATGHRAG